MRLRHMVVAGGVVGFLTGLVLSTGPLSVPIFNGYGLVGGPFLGSEAVSSLFLYAGKLGTFGQAGSLTPTILLSGVAIGSALLAGAMLARPIVHRIQPRTAGLLIDLALVVGGVGVVIPLVG